MKKIVLSAALLLCASAAFAAADGTVLIKGGTFVMGSPESENWREADELQHTVTVNDFYIGTHEVTQAEAPNFLSRQSTGSTQSASATRKANKTA